MLNETPKIQESTPELRRLPVLLAKPPKGDPCNGCGSCCVAEQCFLGAELAEVDEETGICSALVHDGHRFACALVASPEMVGLPGSLRRRGDGLARSRPGLRFGRGGMGAGVKPLRTFPAAPSDPYLVVDDAAEYVRHRSEVGSSGLRSTNGRETLSTSTGTAAAGQLACEWVAGDRGSDAENGVEPTPGRSGRRPGSDRGGDSATLGVNPGKG